MADMLSKHAFGSKENVSAAVEAGTINEYDVIYMSNGEIGWQNGSNETIINTPRTQNDIVVNGAEGLGVEDGDTIPAGTTIDELVTLLVQKAVAATYTKPTITLANNGGQAAGNVEAGTTLNMALKASFVQNDAGDLTSISILNGSTEVATGTSSPLTYADSESIVIGDETLTFKAQASYEAAAVKQNNLGNDSTENWFDAGTITSSNYNIVGKRNAFYGYGTGSLAEEDITSDVVRGMAYSKLNPTAGSTVSLTVATGSGYIFFALPSTRTISQISYDDVGDKSMLSSFVQGTASVADARGGENGLTTYNYYLYNMASAAAAPLNFTFTIA